MCVCAHVSVYVGIKLVLLVDSGMCVCVCAHAYYGSGSGPYFEDNNVWPTRECMRSVAQAMKRAVKMIKGTQWAAPGQSLIVKKSPNSIVE